MAVRIADSLKQQNNLTTFPVAYGADLWLDKNKGEGTPSYDSIQNLYNNGQLGGSSMQVSVMPNASEDYLGNIVQYVGENGTYKKGHFYECIHNITNVNNSYEWQELNHFRFNRTVYSMTTEPINRDFTAGDVIYYTGESTQNFKANHFYRALPNATPQTVYQVNMKETAIVGVMYDCNTPFEMRVGFIVFPSVDGGESTPYQITEITDEDITLTPYGWSGSERTYVGASYSTTVLGWEELEGGGGTSIFYGTMDEWNALSTDAKKQYDYMADDDETSSSVYPSAPTTPELVVDESNKGSNIDKSYTVVKKAFHIVKVHCYSEQESHSAQVYLNNVQIGSESSYQRTSGVGYTVTIPCNVGDVIRTVVSCGGSGTYDKRNAQIFCLN